MKHHVYAKLEAFFAFYVHSKTPVY